MRFASAGTANDGGGDDFAWTVVERGSRPILDTGSGLICVVDPLDPVDGQPDRGGAQVIY